MRDCLICMKKIQIKGIASLFFRPKICFDCFNKMNRRIYKQKIDDVEVVSLYPYEEYISSLIYTFKGCYDIALSPCFLSYDKCFLKLIYKGYYLVCAPSYYKHDELRGFNHVEEIFKELNLPFLKILAKEKDFKQSSLKADDRRKSVNNIVRISDESLKNKRILLVDDIITTGSTIKRSLELLKELNPMSLKVVTIAYTSIEIARNKKTENNKNVKKKNL